MASHRSYDVFLSFRGKDTLRTFVSHLYNELDRRGITSFKDFKELEMMGSGEIIEAPSESLASVTVVHAVEDSKFAIVVVSENYAASVSCLEELVTILHSHEKGSLTIIPIFYEVELSDMRTQTGRFAQHFEFHEMRRDPKDVQLWRSALAKLADITGEDSTKWENEAEMIRKIADDISGKLKHPKLDSFQYPVGMEHHVKAVHKLLDLEAEEKTLIVGICGMGGVGKTWLARYVYDKISHSFHTHVFLENVYKIYVDSEMECSKGECKSDPHREKEPSKGAYKSRLRPAKVLSRSVKEYVLRELMCAKGSIESLPASKENVLLEEIRREAQRTSSSLNLSSIAMKAKLALHKVLIVIDGIDRFEQCIDLYAIADGLGPGSRIILTTRDKTLLDTWVRIYEVGGLRYDEALQLLCEVAFDAKYPPSSSFERLSSRAVGITSGIPLTLRLLGSFLHGKGEEDWETALKQLEQGQDENIMQVLKHIHIRADDEEDSSKSDMLSTVETSTISNKC